MSFSEQIMSTEKYLSIFKDGTKREEYTNMDFIVTSSNFFNIFLFISESFQRL